jgi:hypothetical protein
MADHAVIEEDEDNFEQLDKRDISLISHILIGLGVEREQRQNIISRASGYEMNIRGYDFVLSLIESSLVDHDADFYWFEHGFSLFKREDYFNWNQFRTISSIGTRINNVNNLMPDRISIKHDDIHSFCKEMEHFLFVFSKLGGYDEYRAKNYKDSSLRRSIKYIKTIIGPDEIIILDHFKDFRDFISHSPNRVDSWIYRGVELRDCYRKTKSTSKGNFSFLQDMFSLTESLIGLFRRIQPKQIDKSAFLKKLQLIEDFNLFRGQYILSGNNQDEISHREADLREYLEHESIIRVDFSLNQIGFWVSDGRFISIPRRWYPKLSSRNRTEIGDWTLSQDGLTVVWESLSEKISLADILAGRAAPGVVK